MKLRRLATACLAALAVTAAGALAAADPPKEGYAADPPARATEKQWVFEITYDKGQSTITSARSATAKKPIPTPRAMGRFALELRVGRELLDRVRFDVPLLGDDPRDHDPKRPRKRPAFNHVSTKVKAQMADSPRATVLAFVDRATGDTRLYFWPPDERGQLTPFSAKAATAESTAPAAASATPKAKPPSAASARAVMTDGDAPADGARETGDAGAAKAAASPKATASPKPASAPGAVNTKSGSLPAPAPRPAPAKK